MEAKVLKAVATEVDTMFHEQQHHPKKSEVVAKAKKAVERGASKVKKAVRDHTEPHVYPFEHGPSPQGFHPKNKKTKAVDHKDRRILHAMEAAEAAVLRAIHAEVDTLFHEPAPGEKHKREPVVAQAKTTVHAGVQKASAKVTDIHDHRRDWLSNYSTALIEDYSVPDFFLE